MNLRTIIAIIGLSISLTAVSQTVAPPDAPPSVLPSWLNGFLNSDATSLTLALSPSYAPDLKVNGVSKPWGAGLAVLYPVTDFGFVGARLDYLGGSLWTPSATVGLQYSKKVAGHQVTAFTVGGGILAAAGAGKQNGQVGAIYGGGIHANVMTFAGGRGSVDLFTEVEKWTIFEGLIYRFGAAATIHF